MLVGFYLVIFNFFSLKLRFQYPDSFFLYFFLSNRNLQGKFYSCVSLAS